MGPTRISTLVVAALAAAAVAWLLISSFYYSGMPPTALAAGGHAGRRWRCWRRTRRSTPAAAIERRPGRDPVDPLLVARFVVLAKASALAGAIFAGFYAGLTGWLFVETDQGRDRGPAGRRCGARSPSLALVGAALWLERSCRVPEQSDDDEHEPDQRQGRPGQR